MRSMGEILKSLMPELTSASEVERYMCNGCGREVSIVRVPIIGGPNKGKITEVKKGCICWENGQAREAEQERKEARVRYMVDRYSTVNPDLEQASFETFEATTPILRQALNLAKGYADQFDLTRPMNLLFAGMFGLGKSHLSYSVCKALRERGYVAVFVSVPKLLTIIRGTYRAASDYSEAELLATLSTVEFLVLDDIGAEKSKQSEEGDSWATEKLFEIIDGRSGRHTIYTTNLTSDKLPEKVGKRNFSRMMMNTKPFRFEGDDYRIKNKRF